MQLPPLILLSLFTISLLVTISASTWFTKRLEVICEIFDLPESLLSLLGALGANIPNYAASIVAIATGQMTTGLGIIVGSNIYNIAIILAISTFATARPEGLALSPKQAYDARLVALYTLAIMATTLAGVAVLTLHASPSAFLNISISIWTGILLLAMNLVTLLLFAALARHALHRLPHEEHLIAVKEHQLVSTSSLTTLARLRYIGEALLSLLIALAAVIVMVQSGQAFANDIHLSPIIFGLIVLAIATSLPNTVVVFSLARTGHATASVEEVFSSNSINAALGIALPLLFWHSILQDRLLLLFDTPFMLLLTFAGLLCVIRQRISHLVAILFLLSYVAWILLHLMM